MLNQRELRLSFVALFLLLAAPVAMASVEPRTAECIPWEENAGVVIGEARYTALERPYLVREVVFPSKATGVQLAGELVLPRNTVPYAGVVLVTGSGPQDRDETVEDRKPFLILSDALARAGYAVLRFDDRGVGDSTGEYESAVIPDFADDAAGAVNYLHSVLGKDSGPIGMLGHSEGGLVVLQAARRTNVDFLVLLASPVAPFSDVIFDKTRSGMLNNGEAPEVAEKQAASLRQAIRVIGQSGDPETARVAATEALTSGGLDDEMATAYANAFTTPHWFWVSKHVPMNDIRDFGGPILALYAAQDRGINARLMTELLETEAPPTVEHHTLDCLNHLFQRANASGSIDYSEAGPVLDGETIPVLVDWLGRLKK